MEEVRLLVLVVKEEAVRGELDELRDFLLEELRHLDTHAHGESIQVRDGG